MDSHGILDIERKTNLDFNSCTGDIVVSGHNMIVQYLAMVACIVQVVLYHVGTGTSIVTMQNFTCTMRIFTSNRLLVLPRNDCSNDNWKESGDVS